MRDNMKKNDILDITIEAVQFPNKGIAYVEDTKVIVKNTLPGQRVQVRVSKKRQGGVEGRLLSVIAPAPNEMKPGCSHFGLCGGCAYQNISHKDELAMKEKQVQDILVQWGITGFTYEGIEPSPTLVGYRNKCEFSFGDQEKGGKLALGMRKRQSMYEVVTLLDCNIIDEDYLKIVQYHVDFFQKHNVPFYHKQRHDGVLRHLVVRKGAATGEILINLVTASEWGFSLDDYKNGLLSIDFDGLISGILHTQNDGLADVVISQETNILYGKDFFMECLFALEFKVSAFSFFQTNSRGAEKLYSIVKDFAGDMSNKTIFDLYCGTGTIGQILAHHSKKVIGIELVEEAVEAAKENAQRNGLKHCTFIAGDVLKVVDTITDKPDVIIVDPPREGIHPKALEKIAGFGASEIVYISCKPTSLGRDLAAFVTQGYDVKRVKLMDMFPRTTHVETVVLLSLKTGTPKLEVTMEVDSDSNYSPEEKATYQKIKEYVKNKYGVNVHTRYIAEVKRMCGIDMGENYNKSKKDNPDVKHCPQEKVDYIKEALEYFGTIFVI